MTSGRVGAFFADNVQVGGFFDWRIIVNLVNEIDKSFKTYQLATWFVSAQSYWFEQKIYDVEVRFFADDTNYYWYGNTELGLYRFRPNKLINEPIEFHGSGVLKVKEWIKSN